MLDIEYYIFTELCNPQAAKRIVDGILNIVEGLKVFLKEHALVNDRILRNAGLRMTRFLNYNIFYYYASEKDMIYIIRILYNRADWRDILKK